MMYDSISPVSTEHVVLRRIFILVRFLFTLAAILVVALFESDLMHRHV